MSGMVAPKSSLFWRFFNTSVKGHTAIFRLTGGRGKWLDAYLRSRKMSAEKRRAWFSDQYRHPHESKHTIGEVLDWFDQCGLEFVRGIPSVTAGEGGLARGNLFEPTERGTALDHFLVQTREIVTGSREGGFFIMIGRKPLRERAGIAAGSSNGDGGYGTTTAVADEAELELTEAS